MTAKTKIKKSKNKVPGKLAAKVIARDTEFVTPSHTRLYPLVPARGEGSWIWDVDGNKFLDFAASIAVCATGHAHPEVVNAIASQAGKLAMYSAADFYPPLYVDLCEKLAKISPTKGPNKVYLANCGATAIEAGIKLARHHTKRLRLIAFDNCFHGRTMGALSLTASKLWQQRGFGPLLAGVSHVPFSMSGLERLEKVLFKTNVPPEEVAAIVYEPIQGEGGCRLSEEGFPKRLRGICDEHGILLIADEVQCGMGRTGKMFASEHFGIRPDIVCLAKALGGGLPLGAMIAPAKIMNWPIGAHTSTFGGNNVACAAALATIRLLESTLLKNAQHVGSHLRKGLEKLAKSHSCVGDILGLGMLLGFTMKKSNGEIDKAGRDAVVDRAFENGLLLLGGGEGVVRMTPPLVLSPKEADHGLAILELTLTELKKEKVIS